MVDGHSTTTCPVFTEHCNMRHWRIHASAYHNLCQRHRHLVLLGVIACCCWPRAARIGSSNANDAEDGDNDNEHDNDDVLGRKWFGWSRTNRLWGAIDDAAATTCPSSARRQIVHDIQRRRPVCDSVCSGAANHWQCPSPTSNRDHFCGYLGFSVLFCPRLSSVCRSVSNQRVVARCRNSSLFHDRVRSRGLGASADGGERRPPRNVGSAQWEYLSRWHERDLCRGVSNAIQLSPATLRVGAVRSTAALRNPRARRAVD